MSWETETWATVKQIGRNAHAAGCLDVLRAVLEQFELEPDHYCLARSWAERMYRDPNSFQQFVSDSQAAREG